MAMGPNDDEAEWLNDAFSAEVRARLGRKNLKQADLSRSSGIHKATLSSLLNDSAAWSLRQVEAVSKALGTPPDAIIAAACNAHREQEGGDGLYLSSGRLDPTQVKGRAPAKEKLDGLAARRQADSGQG